MLGIKVHPPIVLYKITDHGFATFEFGSAPYGTHEQQLVAAHDNTSGLFCGSWLLCYFLFFDMSM